MEPSIEGIMDVQPLQVASFAPFRRLLRGRIGPTVPDAGPFTETSGRPHMILRRTAFAAALSVLVLVAGLSVPALGEEGVEEAGAFQGSADRGIALAEARITQQPVEVVSARSAYSTVYAMPDQTWKVERSAAPIRGLNDQDTWAPIDTELVVEGTRVTPEVVAGDVSFSNGGDGPFVSFRPLEESKIAGTSVAESGADEGFDMYWPNELPAPEVTGSTLTYRNVAPGQGDLVVSALPTGFRYDVVLNQPPSAAESKRIAVKVVPTDSSQVRVRDDGSIGVFTNDELTASSTLPVMFDGTVDASASSLTKDMPGVSDLRITTRALGDDTSELVMHPAQKVLRDPQTTYPVTLDPTFTSDSSDDVSVYQSGGSSFDDPMAGPLKVGAFSGDVARALVKFDDSSFNGIAAGDVTSANLLLSTATSGGCNDASLTVERVESAWDSTTATWGNQPATTRVGSLRGVDCPIGMSDISVDVTEMVQTWSDTPSSNHGIRVAAVDETDQSSYVEFGSRSQWGIAPTLVIGLRGDYLNPDDTHVDLGAQLIDDEVVPPLDLAETPAAEDDFSTIPIPPGFDEDDVDWASEEDVSTSSARSSNSSGLSTTLGAPISISEGIPYAGWRACGARDDRFKTVKDYPRADTYHPRMLRTYARFYCGQFEDTEDAHTFGYRKQLLEHARDWSNKSVYIRRNWRDLAGFAAEWSFFQPDIVTIPNDTRFCFARRFYLVNNKTGAVVSKMWTRWYVGRTGVRIMNGFPNNITNGNRHYGGCKGTVKLDRVGG